jgi:hypothetical protein
MDVTYKDVNKISSFQRRKAKAGAEENLFYIAENGEVYRIITYRDCPFYQWFKQVKGIRYQIMEED